MKKFSLSMMICSLVISMLVAALTSGCTENSTPKKDQWFPEVVKAPPCGSWECALTDDKIARMEIQIRLPDVKGQKRYMPLNRWMAMARKPRPYIDPILGTIQLVSFELERSVYATRGRGLRTVVLEKGKAYSFDLMEKIYLIDSKELIFKAPHGRSWARLTSFGTGARTR